MSNPSRQELFSGTEMPSELLALDAGRLEDWLESTVEGFSGPMTIEKFRGGQSNPTYRIATPERVYVLRKQPPGNLLPSAHAVDREYRVIEALYRAGFPVPRPFVYCDDREVVGTPFYVVAHVDGRLFWQVELPGVSAGDRAAIYDSMNETLAALHALDPVALGLGDFGRPGNYLERQFSRWSKQYRAAESEPLPDMDWLIETLPHFIPASSANRLVHGDFGLHNIMIHKTEPRVVAVLDWEIATLGDPLGDLGHHLTAWHLPPDPERASVSSLVGQDLDALGIPDADTYLDRYVARTGSAEFDRGYILAFALFRYAAIIQGVITRSKAGTGVNTNMMHTQERVGLLAAAARKILEQR
jgi:aminoglycoside phosphotransferase (APT) family kinase protein